ncbi:MAG: NAD(P)/FAD-dependent oxidoreductase [Candidatus Paceibacterota bacterium]
MSHGERHAEGPVKKAQVLIIGGGFGGVYAARTLLKKGFNVTLVSKTNFFIFTPLLHEVATGSLNANDVTFEYSDFFHNKNFTFFRETIVGVDFDERLVRTSDDERLSYDYLVISTGARTNFFGAKGSEHALELKTIEDAVLLKRTVVSLAQGIERDVVVNIVGGGPTGIELAFELEEFLRAIKRRSPSLKYKVRLIHAGNSLCTTFPLSVQTYAYNEMKKEGIDVRLETTVTEIMLGGVVTSAGEHLGGDVTVWTAGVTAQTDCVPAGYTDERGNIVVDTTLRIRGREKEFAIGDCIVEGENAIPKLAQTASKQGPVVAWNIDADAHGRELKTYVPRVRGMLLSLGKGRGAGSLFGIVFKGFLGWSIWRSAYLSKIPGFRNKLDVSVTWIISFFSSRDLFER